MKQVYEYEFHFVGEPGVGLAHVEATNLRSAKRELRMDCPGARVVRWAKTPIDGWRQGSRTE